MTKELEVGQVIKGKVMGIQPYGAFVEIDDNVQGLVHISEITHGYVKDIHDYLAAGDDVTVKILDIDEESNKISLSIRATQEPPKKQTSSKSGNSSSPNTQNKDDAGFNTLKEKLQEWMEHAKR